ncbi:MAG: hypothetical protein AB1451_10855 [Nitrospirota bacterium]
MKITPNDPQTSVDRTGGLKLPSPWVILACLVLFGFGETAGAALGGLPKPIMDVARAQAVTRPEVHGLSGVPDIDRAIIEGVQTEVLARVHTFHLHGHGLAIVVFLLTFIVTNTGFTPRVKTLLTTLTCLGLLYPFGWLTMALAVPVAGKAEAFRIAERWFFIPFGGAFLVGVWFIVLAYTVHCLRRNEKPAQPVLEGGETQPFEKPNKTP